MMRKILLVGAGRSATSLIKYLLDNAFEQNWEVTVGDMSAEVAQRKVGDHSRGRGIKFDALDEHQRLQEVATADVVISLLPPSLHYLVARTCLIHKKHLITASYVSREIKEMDKEAQEAGLLFLNEMGLDPGIDHMSAMKVINDLKAKGAKIDSFRSYTGGLVAPKYDNNPWNYKFSWNPRNVVLAGQGTAQLIVNGRYKYIPYPQLFKRISRVYVLNYGEFEAYANRDSLKYRGAYGLDNVPTMVRGTLRRPGFCKAWNVFVQLGATDDSYMLENSETMTYREFINTFLRYEKDITVETKLAKYLGIEEDSFIMYQLRWLGIFQKRPIGLKNATPAQVLQQLLEEKWKLDPDDKDMIAMQHIFGYELNDTKYILRSSLVVEGSDSEHTAMAKTVGYPLGIAAKLLLNGQLQERGVRIPTSAEVYLPTLAELETLGITFVEEQEEGEIEISD